MRNSLLEICSPIFQLTAVFHSSNRGEKLDDSHKEELQTSMITLEQSAYAQQISSTEIQHLKYAMAAFIDETVLNSSWPARNSWMGNPLQLQLFGEHTAGQGFFQRLGELRQMGSQYLNVLEVYYMCLQFGFEGMYRLHNKEKLVAIQIDLRNQIETARGSGNSRLSPQGLPERNLITQIGKKLPFWITASCTGLLLFCIYLGYSFAINHQANKALDNIKISRNQLLQTQWYQNNDATNTNNS